jgi:hypothetical protein
MMTDNDGLLRSFRKIIHMVFVLISIWCFANRCYAQDEADSGPLDDVRLRSAVLKSMQRGCDFLELTQAGDGSWSGGTEASKNTAGVTAMVVMALINCDRPVDSPAVQRGLNYLRALPPGGIDGPHAVYETSLVTMALCAAEQLDQDLPRILKYAELLENSMVRTGTTPGYWGYQLGPQGPSTGDPSNGQYAVLALREAVYSGAQVSRETWELVHQRWVNDQLRDGAWRYSDAQSSSGSITVAGLSTLGITTRMLLDDSDVDANGNPDCCRLPAPDLVLQNGRRWLAQNFSVQSNPGKSEFHFYYLYGLERAGRMSGVRFFGRHDWYRQGATMLTEIQKSSGEWISRGHEATPATNTAMALLFLSKGLSRVVVNKLDYNSPNGESRDDGEWNRHQFDIVNLVELIDGLPAWPPRLTSQVVTMSRLRPETAVLELNQAPILFISGREAPQMTDEQVTWLRNYVDAGGFILAVANCDGQGFDQGFREIVSRMFPQGDASLQPLTPDHAVFRSEYNIRDVEGVKLWGVDFGCRTSIIYSPDDIGCLWQKWMKHEPKNRNSVLSARVSRAMKVGVNVVAYATGREPPEKLNIRAGRKVAIGAAQRGLLQIAKLRHDGGWDTAPRALKNLLEALNENVGLAANAQTPAIPMTLEEMNPFPLLYMHGRYRFRIGAQEQQAVRDFLSTGRVLFADACCGSTNFDRSFREFMAQLYPDHPLKQIPADHEIYSEATWHDIKKTTRRRLVPSTENAALTLRTEEGPPILEGIEVDGRYVVIYSKYDISCALEHQASLSCDGYVEADAAKLAMNIVLYAMQQDIRWSQILKDPTSVP